MWRCSTWVRRSATWACDTRRKVPGPARFTALRAQQGLAHDGLLMPAEVANTYFCLANQQRSARPFELDLRAHADLAW